MTKDEALDLALEALENNRRTHYYCEDTWYSCPKHEDGCANEAEGDECNCGADKANQEIDNAITAIKQARSAPVQEPAEVLGHNGWGFPIKAAAPVQKKCDCAAHSAADCVCGAWDKSAVAPVQEDWGAGPHECHSLTAAPVQEPVAWRYRGILHDFDPSDWAEGPVTPLYTTPPAQPAPVQEPVATIDSLEQEIYENTREFVSLNVMEWLLNRLNTTPPNVATPLAAQRQWVGLTDEEIQAEWLLTPQHDKAEGIWFGRRLEAKLKEKNNA